MNRKRLPKAGIRVGQVAANHLKGVQEDHVLLHSFEGEDEHDPLHLPVRQLRTSIFSNLERISHLFENHRPLLWYQA